MCRWNAHSKYTVANFSSILLFRCVPGKQLINSGIRKLTPLQATESSSGCLKQKRNLLRGYWITHWIVGKIREQAGTGRINSQNHSQNVKPTESSGTSRFSQALAAITIGLLPWWSDSRFQILGGVSACANLDNGLGPGFREAGNGHWRSSASVVQRWLCLPPRLTKWETSEPQQGRFGDWAVKMTSIHLRLQQSRMGGKTAECQPCSRQTWGTVEGLDNRRYENFRQEKKWGLDRIPDRVESWQKLRISWGQMVPTSRKENWKLQRKQKSCARKEMQSQCRIRLCSEWYLYHQNAQHWFLIWIKIMT